MINEYYVLHLPGKGKDKLPAYLKKWKPIRVSNDVTIITIATSDLLDGCQLIRQLNTSGVHYINHASNLNGDSWRKTDKLQLILGSLEEVTTPYVLILDANDVVILRDIDDEFIERWKEFDCDILYNASEYLFPKIFSHKDEQNSVYCQHYLNAGVAFGKTEYAKSVYEEAYRQSQRDEFAPYDSEQYYIRIAWLTHDRMKLDVDPKKKLFLLSHGN